MSCPTMPKYVVPLVCLSLCWACALLVVMHIRAKPVTFACDLPLEWYLDEAAHTGDLVFFKEEVDWLQTLVSPMTHVALVIMHPATGEPYLVETLEEGAMAAGEQQRAGTHMFPARERLMAFDGELSVARIRRPLSATRAMREVDDLKSAPYPRNIRKHVAACKLWPWAVSHQSMMCSEFAARVLTRIGTPLPWKCQTPSDLLYSVSHSPAFLDPCALR